MKPWYRKRIERVLALGDLQDAMGRAEAAIPIPAGALIATRTGTVAHTKSALEPGARCEAMSAWTDWRIVSPSEDLRLCSRCEAGESRVAS